jgi:hypothetical protein
MQEIKPGIPDIIEALAAEMERRGIASRKVAEFRQLWNQLQPHSNILPCPLCFSRDTIGKLHVAQADLFGNEAVRCDTCRAEIAVNRAD